MAEQRPPEEPRRDREVIVTGGGGGGPGTIIAAVVGIILILVVGWFLLNMLGIMGGEMEEPASDDIEVEVDAPEDMDGGEDGGEG